MLLEMDVKLHRGNFMLKTQLELNDTNTGLFGKSGAGKSTILGLIAGRIQPESGRIVLDGKILFDSNKGIMVPHEQRSVSTVFQSDITCSSETAGTILAAAHVRTMACRRLQLDFLIEVLELENLLKCPLIQLTSNEHKRVSLARALLKSPRLLLLDEIFASLGKSHRSQLIPILRRSQEELDLPILYASKSLGEILELTEQLIVMDNGEVLRSGSLSHIAKHSGLLRHLGIRQVDNLLPVTISRHHSETGTTHGNVGGFPVVLKYRPELPVNSQCKVSIRANDIALSKQYISGISIQNQIKGRICALIPHQDGILVQIDCGSTLIAEITRGACQQMALMEGQEVYCLIKTQAIIYLADLDMLPHQRIIAYGNNYYYVGIDGAEPNLFNE